LKYCPQDTKLLTFHDAYQAFLKGTDTPSAYLERCLEVIDKREPIVKAWVSLNVEGAREAAKAATKRYKNNAPLSMIDGMPIGIKDMIETKDMPTELGSPAYKGRHTYRDSAIIWALREAGAIILGKTVTTTLAFLDPGPTTNPFDSRRTPGGSSSGSAAAVGAGMVPVTIGTQLVASILRPAGYCGNWALKPSIGAFNRGEGLEFSQSHHGILASNEIDLWHVATEIAHRVGGDPGYPGLYGQPNHIPPAQKPSRLAILETEGWGRVEPSAKAAFNQAVKKLQESGISVLQRTDCNKIEALEQSIANAVELSLRISAWEHRWILENMAEQHPEKIGKYLRKHLEKSRQLTLAEYRQDLAARDEARARLKALEPIYDGLITLSAVGIAPIIAAIENSQFPTGDLSMGCPASLLGSAAYNVPALSDQGMPLGLQIMGQQDWDERTLGYARWIHQYLIRAD